MENEVRIEVSARHVHLRGEHCEALFGKRELEPRDGKTGGMVVYKEKVDVIGPKRTLTGLTILGPDRGLTQVELSMTDAHHIGVDAPLRESGDTKGSGKCKLVGTVGELEMEEGVIIAWRHVHLNSKDADIMGVQDRDIVSVEVREGKRPLVFDNCIARVHPKVATAMHIDTDEGNAAGIYGIGKGEIINIVSQSQADAL